MHRLELVCAPHLAHVGIGALRPVQVAGEPAALRPAACRTAAVGLHRSAGGSVAAVAVAAESEQRQEEKVPWWRWLQWQWWGLDLAWTRWWFGFDQTSQQAWLQMRFGAQLRWLGVAIVMGCSASLATGWLLLRLGLWSRSPLAQSLHLMARRGVVPLQGESFPRLCQRAAKMKPDLAPLFQAMADQQQLLAHAPLTPSQRRHHLRQWRQLRSRLGRLH